MPDPVLSIVTGTRHRYASLERFLNSVHATASVLTEVIIADASDVMQDTSLLRAPGQWNNHISKVNRFHELPRLGPNKGYNVAFRKTTGKYVAWFNDDCELLPGWDKTAIEFMDAHPEVGIGAIYWRDLPNGTYYLQSLQHLIYANFGVYRGDIGRQIDWFDEREVYVQEMGKSCALTFYGNDTGAAFKMIDAGYAVAAIPGCKVDHYREQDREREQNMKTHRAHDHLPGRILSELYGGQPGFDRLRAKAAKFKNLDQPLYL